MTSADPDPAGTRMLARAFRAQALLGAGCAVLTGLLSGRFAGQSVALGAFFAAAHLYTVMRSVHGTYGDEISPAARFFMVFRSLRFLIVLASAALVLSARWASGVGFLFGYALLLPAITFAAIARSADEP